MKRSRRQRLNTPRRPGAIQSGCNRLAAKWMQKSYGNRSKPDGNGIMAFRCVNNSQVVDFSE